MGKGVSWRFGRRAGARRREGVGRGVDGEMVNVPFLFEFISQVEYLDFDFS